MKNVRSWYYKPSEIFWFIIFVILLIIIGFISKILLTVILLIGSVISIGSYEKTGSGKINIWVLAMPICWLAIILYGVFYCSGWLYERTIIRFNDWLNSKIK